MMRALVLVAAALALSAASASADGYSYRHHYGYHYGYATPYAGPVFEYTGNAYYGYPAPSYSRTPYPIYAAVPPYAAPRPYGYAGDGYAPGCWGGCRYGWR